MAASKVKLAREIRKALAIHLVVSALFAVADISTGGTEMAGGMLSMALMAASLGATFAGGAGPFLGKN